MLEYAVAVWWAIPDYLSDVIEGVQKKALRIIYLEVAREQALLLGRTKQDARERARKPPAFASPLAHLLFTIFPRMESLFAV